MNSTAQTGALPGGELGVPKFSDEGRTAMRAAGGRSSAAQVARLFHCALALIFLVAWLSLASQVRLLVGSRGLLPLVDFLAAARAEQVLSFWRFPTLLTWAASDGALYGGCLAGAALALVALFGVRPRACAAVQILWYLGYVTACRGFLGFQWDNLLLECGLLAVFLPVDRPAPLAHLLCRALLFKLYFESGIAKWQSPLHDWQDGSAMTFYYQTAPLPTALAWYAHHLPRWWHLFESRATLAIELLLPFAIFGPRRARLGAAVLFTSFQIINAATANYGFFCYLAVALHLFLLDDDHAPVQVLMDRVRGAAGRLIRRRADVAPARPGRGAPGSLEPGSLVARAPMAAAATSVGWAATRRIAGAVAVAAWVFASLTVAWFHFGEPGPGALPLLPVLEASQTFRVVNAYHLFAAVTRERIEPEFQVQAKPGAPWVPCHFHYKAGPLFRPPPLVAPHQPRVDFLLWFYGLGRDRRQPAYVGELLARLCDEPSAVAALFESPLPAAPAAVRVVFWDYRFTSAREKRETGAWWTRRLLGEDAPVTCPPH